MSFRKYGFFCRNSGSSHCSGKPEGFCSARSGSTLRM
nr:MAG: MC035R-like protein [Molluscum contagiosum virus]